MEQSNLFKIIISIFLVGMACFGQVYAGAMDDYNQKCASCHGLDGLGHDPIDGSDCSLKSIEEVIECYPLITAHNYVDDCDDDCIVDTNTYVIDELLFQIGKNQYAEMCAVCHGDDGMEGAPIDGSHCDLSALQDVVDCYSEIAAHDSISSCDDTCIWYTNKYVLVALLDNTDTEPPDNSTDNVEPDDQSIGDIFVNNDNWVGCFIAGCLN